MKYVLAITILVVAFTGVVHAQSDTPKNINVRIYAYSVKGSDMHLVTVAWDQISIANTSCIIKERPIIDNQNYNVSDCQPSNQGYHGRQYFYSRNPEIPPAYKVLDIDKYYIEEYNDGNKIGRYGPYDILHAVHIPRIDK